MTIQARINLRNCPFLARLLQDGETLEDLLKLTPEQILLRWINFHLKEAGSNRRVANFGHDLCDSEAYCILLKQAPPLLHQFHHLFLHRRHHHHHNHFLLHHHYNTTTQPQPQPQPRSTTTRVTHHHHHHHHPNQIDPEGKCNTNILRGGADKLKRAAYVVEQGARLTTEFRIRPADIVKANEVPPPPPPARLSPTPPLHSQHPCSALPPPTLHAANAPSSTPLHLRPAPLSA